MGVGLRRVKEKVKQATGLQGKNFQPTSNVRNVAMMREATDFAAHLKKCEKAITDMKAATDVMLTTTKTAMSAPLPHVYEDTAAGAGGEVRPVVSIGGPAFQSDTVIRLSQQASAQIESQVLVPIKRWIEVFSTLQARIRELEQLRLEVDSRRHTVIDLATSVDKQRTKLSKANGGDGKLEGGLDDTIKKLQHKETKLSLSVQSFQEKELSLYSDLSTLIKDASWLRHYMASALRIQGEALTGAARALGDTVRPESGVDVSSLSLGSQGPGTSASQQTPGGVGSSMNAPGGGMMQQQQQQQQQQSVDGGSGSAVNPFLSSGVIRQ